MFEDKSGLDINYLKKIIPRYFGEMDDDLFSGITGSISCLSIDRGDNLFHTGDPGDSLYILFSGRIQIYTGGISDPVKISGYVQHGGIIGLKELITDEPRSFSARAMRPSFLARIPSGAIKKAMQKDPQILFTISKDLISATNKPSFRSGENFTPGNILFVQTSSGIDINGFLNKFGSQLRNYTTSRTATPDSLKGDITRYSNNQLNDILSTLNRIERKYDHLLISCPYGNTGWLKMAGVIADKVYLLVDFSAGPEPTDFEKEALKHIDRRYANVEIVFCHRDDSLPKNTRDYISVRENLNHFHVRLNEEKDFARLARILSGNAVALVLGGGGARGYSHIGVIRALAEHGIFPDLICGSSVGSSIGAGAALGWNTQKQYDSCVYFSGQKPFIDLTLPYISFVSGKRIDKALQDIFGDYDIEDTLISYFAVTSNLTKIKAEPIRTGKIREACRASMSLPVVLPPVVKNRDFMVDGSVFNNVPVDIMQRLYNCKVIGVNVSSQEEYNLAGERFPAPVEFFAAKMKQKYLDSYPNFFSIILKLSSIAAASKLSEDARTANIILNPPVAQYNMLDMDKIDDIVQAGYDYTLSKMQEIKKSLTN